jgi:hypothetical protein
MKKKKNRLHQIKVTFFQVLECDEATVSSVYGMIEEDKRHKDVTLIQKENITERAFPYWSMGFDKIDAKELSNMDGLNDFFEHDFTRFFFLQAFKGLTSVV